MNVEIDQQSVIASPLPAVGGWLTVLCLVLVFGAPATAAYSVFWQTLPKLISADNVARAVLLGVYCVVFTGLAIGSVLAGVKLWLVQPKADLFARKYLLTYLAGHIGYFVFWFLLTRPTETLSLADLGWHHVVAPIGSTALWYFYLENSTRVSETYSQP